MAIGIQYSKEGKDIINKFENLTPWDKADILKYLADKSMTWEEIEKYFIEGTGYVDYNTIDFVKEVIDNNQEYDVLDEMDDWDIVDYLINSFDHYRNASNLSDWIEKSQSEDVSEAIDRVDKENLDLIMDDLYENHKDRFMYILDYFNKTLAKHSS